MEDLANEEMWKWRILLHSTHPQISSFNPSTPRTNSLPIPLYLIKLPHFAFSPTSSLPTSTSHDIPFSPSSRPLPNLHPSIHLLSPATHLLPLHILTPLKGHGQAGVGLGLSFEESRDNQWDSATNADDEDECRRERKRQREGK
jgi:hypothetical protein